MVYYLSLIGVYHCGLGRDVCPKEELFIFIEQRLAQSTHAVSALCYFVSIC